MNLQKAKEEFIKYTENYDLTNENIRRKQAHSLRVMENSKQIAIELGLSQEEIEVATLIGLLHDIARFEQYTKHQTFRDLDSFDHGDYGVEILNKYIRKYVEEDQYDDLIKVAIKNHNKYKIEKKLTGKQQLFAKLIRDADKIDILYEGVEIFYKNEIEEVNSSKISEEILEQFRECKTIKRKKNTNIGAHVDKVVSIIALIFDVNYKCSFDIIKQKDYINKILDRFDFKDEYTKQSIEEIRNIANKYIERRKK